MSIGNTEQKRRWVPVVPCPRCAAVDDDSLCRAPRDCVGGEYVPIEEPSTVKDTNPKDGIGMRKVPLHLVSGVVKAYQALAHYLGNIKYGAHNYLACGARASVYRSALERHMDRWWSGEEFDPVDGTPHLANAQACLNILIETSVRGNLVDDRPPATDLVGVYAMVEETMAKLQVQYADMTPRHYTIADTEFAHPQGPSDEPA